MKFEQESYHIYIQRIEALTLQLQDIKYSLRDTISFINKIKERTPDTHFETLQQLTLSALIDKHVQDLALTNQKLNRVSSCSEVNGGPNPPITSLPGGVINPHLRQPLPCVWRGMKARHLLLLLFIN
jgi:hypothetical protein